MAACKPSSGELRAHYTTFSWPGVCFWRAKGDVRGTRAVLEVRAHDVLFMVAEGRPFALCSSKKRYTKPILFTEKKPSRIISSSSSDSASILGWWPMTSKLTGASILHKKNPFLTTIESFYWGLLTAVYQKDKFKTTQTSHNHKTRMSCKI